MKPLYHKFVKYWFVGMFLCHFLLLPTLSYAQQISKIYRISLQQAIELGKLNNNLVKAAVSEEDATAADLKDAKANALPSVFANADYERFTSLTLYNDFLGKARSVPKRPSSNGSDASLSATFNLYSGGKQKAFEAEQGIRKDIAVINTKEQSANVGLQVVASYLDMVRLNDQKRFMEEQVLRAETRLKNINALYNNQKVTRSDVLRAELNLSSAKLNLDQVENDIEISNQKLIVLLSLPDTSTISPADSSAMPRPAVDSLIALTYTATKDAYAVKKNDDNIKLQNARIAGVRSNYKPSVALFTAYGLSYPNTIFYPPVDQAYSIGFVGVKIQYNISSIYQNKNKVKAGNIRLQELQYVQRNITDNINQVANSFLIKYREALNRISVNEKSIEQARVNYKIVSAKYFNQLALLTDLLDADNLYEESRYNLVQAQTNAQFLYYQLLYTSGKL